MKRPLILLFVLLLLMACGEGGHTFTLKGKMQNMNQAEFYIYASGSSSMHLDTIHVNNGSFAYTTSLEKPTTLLLIFPNFSELPIMGEPGETAKLEADASHLREALVTGTKANKEMTQLRREMLDKSPSEQQKIVYSYIKDNPESPISAYLFMRHFFLGSDYDRKQYQELTALLSKAQPDNTQLQTISTHVRQTSSCQPGTKLPPFSIRCIDGSTVSDKTFASDEGVIISYASWNFESTAALGDIRRMHNSKKGKFHVLAINLDADKSYAEAKYLPDSLKVPTYCDSQLFSGGILRTLGISTVPEIIYTKNGKIEKRGISINDLRRLVDNKR